MQIIWGILSILPIVLIRETRRAAPRIVITIANTFRHLIHSNDKPTHNKNNFLKFNYYLNSTVTLLVRITTLFIRILVFKRRSYDIYSIYTYSI